MDTLRLVGGALALRNATFTGLRERSDVFYRGFLVLLVVGLWAGAFEAGFRYLLRQAEAQNPSQLTQTIVDQITISGNIPESARPMIESYVRESVGIGVDISQLPPLAGAAFRPVASVLQWLSQTVATPFSFLFLGYMLLSGILVHMTSRWLGGKGSAAQMLGLTALGYAPHVLDPLSSLFAYLGQTASGALFNPLNSLLGWVVFIWGTAIFIKGTAVAQGFSIGRSISAILVALLVALVIGTILVILGAILIAALIVPLVPATG